MTRKLICVGLTASCMALLIASIFVVSNTKVYAIENISPVYYYDGVYGKSGLGRDLEYSIVHSKVKENHKKILLVFGIHGYEDAWDRDGLVLSKIADNIKNHYMENVDDLNGNIIYIVKTANPDGLLDGKTNEGIGRCQVSRGIDIGRDFNYHFRVIRTNRNKTGSYPLSSIESKYLAEFTQNIKPDIVVDNHGWLERTYGDFGICDIFNNFFGTIYRETTDDGYRYQRGSYAGWASTVCKQSVMFEFPFPYMDKYYNCENYISIMTHNYISAINAIYSE